MPALRNTYPRRTDAVIAFLADPANTQGSSFLSSVASAYQRSSYLTASQEGAVGRIMLERGWRVIGVEEGSPIWQAPDVPLETDESGGGQRSVADYNSATEVLNGVFTVSVGGEDHRFRIFTVLRTSNDGLRHKRVVARYVDGTWVNFAFLTSTGRLKIWRRFADQSQEDWPMAAVMLNMLRRHRGARRIRDVDPLGVAWTVTVVSYNCRYCPGELGSASQLERGHDGCAVARRNAAPTPDLRPSVHHTDWSRPAAMVDADRSGERVAAGATTVGREVFTPSQVTGSWEQ